MGSYVQSLRPCEVRGSQGIATSRLANVREPQQSPQDDRLPAFTALDNDEDWQKKAEYQPQGTYWVIATSSSFANSEDYRQGGGEGQPSTASSPYSEYPPTYYLQDHRSARPPALGLDTRLSTLQSVEYIPRPPSVNKVLDANTVVLGSFEENSKGTILEPPMSAAARATSTQVSPSYAPTSPFETIRASQHSQQQQGKIRQDVSSMLFAHYRAFVRKNLFMIREEQRVESCAIQDVFEAEARSFEPVSFLPSSVQKARRK